MCILRLPKGETKLKKKKKKKPDKVLTLVKTRMNKIANFNDGHSITLGLKTTINSTNKNQDKIQFSKFLALRESESYISTREVIVIVFGGYFQFF